MKDIKVMKELYLDIHKEIMKIKDFTKGKPEKPISTPMT